MRTATIRVCRYRVPDQRQRRDADDPVGRGDAHADVQEKSRIEPVRGAPPRRGVAYN
jgi:hypothetical protein